MKQSESQHVGGDVDDVARRRMSPADHLDLLGLLRQAPGFVCFLRGASLVFELANDAYYQLVGHREVLGKTVREALPEVAGQGYFELLDRVSAKAKRSSDAACASSCNASRARR
jgi:hypothetical protein